MEKSEKDWLDMCADIFAVIFQSNGVIVSKIKNEDSELPASKKRKVATNIWEEFLNSFSDEGITIPALLQWLQLFTSLISKHPQSMPSDLIANFFRQLLIVAKRFH